MSKPVDGNSNWCCWPFSLCCGGSSTPPEKQPLKGNDHGTGVTRPRSMTPPVSQAMMEKQLKKQEEPREQLQHGIQQFENTVAQLEQTILFKEGAMEKTTSTNWCCWPFSLCCGETGTAGERKALIQQPKSGEKSPGGTPVRETGRREQKGPVRTDEFV